MRATGSSSESDLPPVLVYGLRYLALLSCGRSCSTRDDSEQRDAIRVYAVSEKVFTEMF